MRDNCIYNEQEITNMFNIYFVNVAANLKEPTQLSDFYTLRTFVDSKVHPDAYFDIPTINVAFFKTFLSSLHTTKATGLDCTGPKLLKLARDVLAQSSLSS